MQIVNVIIKTACCIILILTSISAFAQEQLDKYYLFNNYTPRNGLINSLIYSMATDKQGFVWIGSELGLSRFDGKSFYHNTIPEINDNSACIYYLKTANNGNIICSAYMQGIYEQLDDGSFKNYYTLPKNIRKNVFYTIKQKPDETILLGGPEGLFHIDGDSLLLLYEGGIPRMFFSLEVDNNNKIWFGGINGLGTMETDNSGLKPFFIPELENSFVIYILFDKQGTLHVATSRGYYRINFEEPFHPGSKYTVSQPFGDSLGERINFIYLDHEQNVWISSALEGMFRTRGDSITLHLTLNNGLLSSSVLSMTQDKEGNYYFGTNKGLSIVKDFNTYAFAKDGKLFQEVDQIYSDKYDRLWIQNMGFLSILQNGQIYNVDLKNTLFEKLGDEDFYFNDQSEMWICNYNEIFRMNVTEQFPDMKKAKKLADISKYNSERIMSVFEDNNGLWVCTRTILFNYHHDRMIPVTFNHPDSSILSLHNITKDNFGYYWLGDNYNGLFRATLTENTKDKIVFDNIIAYKSLNTDSSFLTTGIYDIAIDEEGCVWQSSTRTGVYKHTIDSTGVISSKLYSTENGLLSNIVYFLNRKEDGSIWIYTPKGICIFKKDANGVERFDYIDEKDGVAGRPYNSIKIRDQIFTLTDNGLFVMSDNFTDESKTIIPKVIITGFSVGGVDYTSEVNKNKTLPLGYNQNNLMFDFSSITFNYADEIAYQYRLEGLDNEWSELSYRGYKEYASLKPGKYTFNVRVVSEDGTSGEETTFAFRIGRVYYQTVWFYLLICLLISALVYVLYNNRIKHVIKTEHLRARIAADLHDDIGSTLSSIFLLSEISVSSNKRSMLEEVLHKISDNSREILNSMDDIIWSVKPHEDSLDNLIIRLREFAIPLCESKSISLYMNIEPSISSLKLEMDERRNIYLITKESINNAIKHSGCTKLEVTFSVNNRHIEVVINDNGIGFDPKSPTSRNGMINMNRRAMQIGRRLVILSEKSKGTTIRLKAKK